MDPKQSWVGFFIYIYTCNDVLGYVKCIFHGSSPKELASFNCRSTNVILFDAMLTWPEFIGLTSLPHQFLDSSAIDILTMYDIADWIESFQTAMQITESL